MLRRYLQLLFLWCWAFFIATQCNNSTYSQGERLYKAHCANCHMEDGTGLAKLIPPLANADYLKQNQAVIPCILKNGQKGEIVVNGTTYNQEMPGQKYTDVQINNIINYINTAWGNQIPTVTIKETQARLSACTEEGDGD